MVCDTSFRLKDSIAPGLRNYCLNEPVCTIKPKKYILNEVIANHFRFYAPKNVGFEPGFKAKRAWKPSDDGKLDNPHHRFHILAKGWIDEQIQKILQNKLTTNSNLLAAIMKLDEPDLPIDRLLRLQHLINNTNYTKILLNEPCIRQMIIERILETDSKFNKIHYIKGDYIKVSKNSVAIPLSHVRSNIIVQKYQQFVSKKLHKQKNLESVIEVMANDIYNALGFGGLKLKLFKTFYEDGCTPKLMLDGTQIQGPNGEKFITLEGQIKKGALLNNQVKDHIGKKIPIDKAELAAGKIISLLMGDWDRVGCRGENMGYYVDNHSGKIKWMNIDPGHALKYPEYAKPLKKNRFRYVLDLIVYWFKRNIYESSLLTFKNIHNNFAIDQPRDSLYHLINGGYNHFTCFDDTLLSEKMAGVRRIQDNWKNVEAILDDYIQMFSAKGDLDFKRELLLTKQQLTQRKNYILEVFHDRLKLNDAELTLLDNIEKLTSKTKDHVTISNKKYYFQHLKVKNSTRCPWKMHEKEGSFELTFTSTKRFGAERQAKRICARLNKFLKNNKQAHLCKISNYENEVSMKISKRDFHDVYAMFNESLVAKHKNQSLFA